MTYDTREGFEQSAIFFGYTFAAFFGMTAVTIMIAMCHQPPPLDGHLSSERDRERPVHAEYDYTGNKGSEVRRLESIQNLVQVREWTVNDDHQSNKDGCVRVDLDADGTKSNNNSAGNNRETCSDQTIDNAVAGEEDDGDEGTMNQTDHSLDHRTCCSICLVRFREKDIICQSNNSECIHTFHLSCMAEWLTKHDHCPLCRKNYLMEAP